MSNILKPTTTKNGGSHYPNLYKIEGENNVKLQAKLDECRKTFGASLVERDKLERQLAHRNTNNENLHGEIDRLKAERTDLDNALIECEDVNERLRVEARMSVQNLQEMKYYRFSSRCWCSGSVVMLIGILSFAVWGMR